MREKIAQNAHKTSRRWIATYGDAQSLGGVLDEIQSAFRHSIPSIFLF